MAPLRPHSALASACLGALAYGFTGTPYGVPVDRYHLSGTATTGPRAFLSPTRGHYCHHGQACRSHKRLRMAKDDEEEDEEQQGRALFGIPNPFLDTYNAGRALRESLDNAIDQITGVTSRRQGRLSIPDLEEYERITYSQFDSDEEIPEVLVVGATGLTGVIVVRKLILRGFRVRVLVRNLFSATLDLLGTGVTYARGDLTDQKTIIDAVSGADKVIFCAQARNSSQANEVEYEGFKNLVSAFQDARVADYGNPYATKRALFKFSRQGDISLWSLNQLYPRVKWGLNKFGHAQLGSTNLQSFGYIQADSQPLSLNLGPFSGFILRALGDGQDYRMILRTDIFEKTGVQFEATIETVPGKWITHRVPFSDFEPYLNGEALIGRTGLQLDRRGIKQVGLAYVRSPKDPAAFLFNVDYIKVYRTQIEPEFVYVSSAAVPNKDDLDYEFTMQALQSTDRKAYWCAQGEEVLRKSGLTYTIVRVSGYNNAPGGLRAVRVRQEKKKKDIGPISRADTAEICVNALLDPKACNLAFYASQSAFAPTAVQPERDLSAQFGKLQPNS